jgi:hypothetical protein
LQWLDGVAVTFMLRGAALFASPVERLIRHVISCTAWNKPTRERLTMSQTWRN